MDDKSVTLRDRLIRLAVPPLICGFGVALFLTVIRVVVIACFLAYLVVGKGEGLFNIPHSTWLEIRDGFVSRVCWGAGIGGSFGFLAGMSHAFPSKPYSETF